MPDSNIAIRLIREIGKLGFLKASLHQILLWPAVCLTLGALLWYAVLSKIDADRIEFQKNAFSQASTVAHAYAQYVANAIDQVDQIALRVKHDWERSHRKLNLATLSESGIFRGSQTVLVSIVNRKGMPVTHTRWNDLQIRPANLADRDYFRFHQNDRSNVILIGKPLIGRLTGRNVMQFTRRLEAVDGSFDGVVSVSVTPDYLTSFFAGANPGNTGLLAVVGNDGSLRAARIGAAAHESSPPAFRAIPLFDTRQGSTFLEGKQWFADEQARFVAWETLKTYPMVVMSGIAERELLVPHKKTSDLYRQQAVAASVILFLLALAGIGWSTRLAWRRQHAEEVRQAYRIATESGNEGFYMLEALRDMNDAIVDFEVVDCNERGAAFYGLEKVQVLGAKFSAQYPAPIFDEMMETLRKAMAAGFYEDEREIPLDSPMKMGWVRRKLVRAGTGLAVTVEDISERKQAEGRQRLAASVFDNAAEGIMITDKDNNILSVNRAFTEITGYSSEEAIGRNPRMLSSGLQSNAFYDAMWSSIGEMGRWQGEVWDRRKDGRPYCELLSIAVIRDDQGKIAQHCSILSDITKLKLTEAELMALNTELEDRVAQRTAALDHANKELETFSYSVSHDLRAPLRHISGFSAIVLKENEGKLDAVSADYLKRINAAGERMGVLIDDLLALSRVSRQELNKRDFDLSELAVQAANSLVKAHPEREVRVTVKPEMKAHGDPGLARIVLENLIGNAWKFTARANEPAIEVGLDERDGETVYYVRDNGAGFDMKYAHKLFEPFQRLHTDREFQGTGIGLSIVQRIVARHGGKIWAEAKTGDGAAFYFTLRKRERAE
jgi:PAS domain S-box-containing protein